jgi:hypothetical protein
VADAKAVLPRIFEERASKIEKTVKTRHFMAIQRLLTLAHRTNYGRIPLDNCALQY